MWAQVQDDYFTLPKIGKGSHMLEDTLGTGGRMGGTKSSKYNDDDAQDPDGGAGGASRGRDGGGSKSGAGGQGPVGSEGRAGTPSAYDDRATQRGHTASSDAFSMLPADSRTGTAPGGGGNRSTRRGPLPGQKKASGQDTGALKILRMFHTFAPPPFFPPGFPAWHEQAIARMLQNARSVRRDGVRFCRVHCASQRDADQRGAPRGIHGGWCGGHGVHCRG